MENQHRLITGYREMDQETIENMNEGKAHEHDVLLFMKGLENADPRWLAIAKTDLQQGFMALGRAIARPEGY